MGCRAFGPVADARVGKFDTLLILYLVFAAILHPLDIGFPAEGEQVMNSIEIDDVEKRDMRTLQYVERKTDTISNPTETTVSFDINIWKGKIKGFFKRVTGRMS